jgi:DivIVA domain-containing protein
MGTALIYILMLLAVAALFFLLAALVFGRGEELAPIPPGASPTWLPERDVAASDVRAVRFQQAFRGYRMSEVDWVLDRLANELERTGDERDQLRRRVTELESHGAGLDRPGTDQGGTDERSADERSAGGPGTDERSADGTDTDEQQTEHNEERTEA